MVCSRPSEFRQLWFTNVGTDASTVRPPAASLLDSSMSVRAEETWMASTDRLRLRLMQAADAVALREVTEPGLVEAADWRRRRRAPSWTGPSAMTLTSIRASGLRTRPRCACSRRSECGWPTRITTKTDSGTSTVARQGQLEQVFAHVPGRPVEAVAVHVFDDDLVRQPDAERQLKHGSHDHSQRWALSSFSEPRLTGSTQNNRSAGSRITHQVCTLCTRSAPRRSSRATSASTSSV